MLRDAGVPVTELRRDHRRRRPAAFEVMRDMVYNPPIPHAAALGARSRTTPIALGNLPYYPAGLLTTLLASIVFSWKPPGRRLSNASSLNVLWLPR